MASIQARMSRGHKYWYIVESRRVNGKPRPITLAYLGRPEDLLLRLQQKKPFELRSYSHGDTRALLQVAEEIDMVQAINQFVPPNAHGHKPIRQGLTVGASLLLAALGRACHPTSKMGWYRWAQTTDLEYVLRKSFKKLDSQHFWDQMEALPAYHIEAIEEKLVQKMFETYHIKPDLLLLDTTNFFTFIHSTNFHCDIPQRGKNKQRRMDLRQIGLALLVTREDHLPLFHRTLKGNKVDVTNFKTLLDTLRSRINFLVKDLEDVTLVFDRGNNSKKNLKQLDQTSLHYVGALTPAHHRKLIEQANQHFEASTIEGERIPTYRVKQSVWGGERTLVVLISEQLKKGQIRGILQDLKKKRVRLEELKERLENKEGKRRKKMSRDQIVSKIETIIKGQYIQDILSYTLKPSRGSYHLDYCIDRKKFDDLKQNYLGRRILMTDRHNWTTEEIILAYRGQSKVEYAFRNLKNPFHLAIRPQYHWTDQKIEVHIFICLLAYLMTMVVFMKAKKKAGYTGSVHNLMEGLKQIRLATLIEKKQGRRGRLKVDYQLEEIPDDIKALAEALNINNDTLRSSLCVGVYN